MTKPLIIIGILGLLILLSLGKNNNKGIAEIEEQSCLTKYLSTSFASVKICIPEGWRLEKEAKGAKIVEKENEAVINIFFSENDDSTNLEIPQPGDAYYKSLKNWRRNGHYYEYSFEPLGAVDPKLEIVDVKNYVFPLNKGGIKIEFTLTRSMNQISREQGEEMIESMEFFEIT